MAKFYVTTTIYYVNDAPHIGHAYTTLVGDVISRYWRQKLGKDNVFFLTGTDEHGQKIQQAAEEKGLSPKDFADSVVPRFQEAWKILNIDYDFFIRTTDPRHENIVMELLQKVYKNGFIYRGIYKGLYCVGCEKFLTDSDIVDGKCPLHPNKQPEHKEEKNYFLKLKQLAEKEVLPRIESGEYDILPEKRKNEIISRLKQGVEDISISREGVSWGIPLPWDTSQTIYVWVDALINYYSATQFIEGKKTFWPADVHVIGKDISWFHTVIWQSLLIAAGIELPRSIFAHGFFTIDGQKISKSLGNVISPQQLVERYNKGADAARYLLLTASQTGDDADISFQKLDEKYQSDLANGLGNLVSRIAKLAENSQFEFKKTEFPKEIYRKAQSDALEEFRFSDVLSNIWITEVHELDGHINYETPWTREGRKLREVLQYEIDEIRIIAEKLIPFLPGTAEKIQEIFRGPKVKAPEKPLFPRLKT